MADQNSTDVPHIASQQEKLDALFGISHGQDIDSFLDSLSLDDAKKALNDKDEALSGISQLSSIEQRMQEKMADIEAMPTSMSLSDNQLSIQMMSMDHSLSELEEMVTLSKDIIKHVHASILATPLIDSEAVQAYSKLVESIHISISEFIGVYRDKQNFVNKVKYALFDKEIKKELMDHKAKLQKELILAKEGPKSIDADAIQTNVNSWNVDQITKMIDSQNMSQKEEK